MRATVRVYLSSCFVATFSFCMLLSNNIIYLIPRIDGWPSTTYIQRHNTSQWQTFGRGMLLSKRQHFRCIFVKTVLLKHSCCCLMLIIHEFQMVVVNIVSLLLTLKNRSVKTFISNLQKTWMTMRSLALFEIYFIFKSKY